MYFSDPFAPIDEIRLRNDLLLVLEFVQDAPPRYRNQPYLLMLQFIYLVKCIPWELQPPTHIPVGKGFGWSTFHK